MKSSSTKFLTIIIGLILTIVGFFGLHSSNLQFELKSFPNTPFSNASNGTILSNYKLTQKQKLPLFLDYQPPNNPTYSFQFQYQKGQQTSTVLQTNACPEIVFLNQQELWLNPTTTNSDPKITCSGNNINLDLQPFLQEGSNTLDIVLSKTEYKFLNLNGSWSDINFSKNYFLVFFGLVLILIGVCNYMQFNWLITSILSVGLATRLAYFYTTTPYNREDDATGHIDYINLIGAKQTILSDTCWQCYHQPFYHSIISFWKDYWIRLGLENIAKWEVATQGLSLFISFLTLIIAIKIIQLCFQNYTTKTKFAFYLAISLFTFWSGNVQQSVKINNDLLVQFFGLLSNYLILLWFWNKKTNLKKNSPLERWQTKFDGVVLVLYLHKIKTWIKNNFGLITFNFALLFACLSTLAKSSGAVNLLIILALAIYRLLGQKNSWTDSFIQKNIPQLIKIITIPILIITLTTGLIIHRATVTKSDNRLVANASLLDPKSKLNNTLVEISWLDLNVYLGNIGSNYSKLNSPLTFGQLLKTSIITLDNFEIKNQHLINWLQLQYIVMLVMIIILILALLNNNNLKNPINIVIICYFISFLAGRIASPYLPTVNIRYILPVLLFIGIVVTQEVDSWNNHKLKLLVNSSLVLFVMAGIITSWSMLIAGMSVF